MHSTRIEISTRHLPTSVLRNVRHSVMPNKLQAIHDLRVDLHNSLLPMDHRGSALPDVADTHAKARHICCLFDRRHCHGVLDRG